MSRFDRCDEHGDVIAIHGRCPWCDVEVAELATYPSPIHRDLQLAVEVMTLLHLTEPKVYR